VGLRVGLRVGQAEWLGGLVRMGFVGFRVGAACGAAGVVAAGWGSTVITVGNRVAKLTNGKTRAAGWVGKGVRPGGVEVGTGVWVGAGSSVVAVGRTAGKTVGLTVGLWIGLAAGLAGWSGRVWMISAARL